MRKAKTDKGWAGHKLYQYTHYNKDIDTYEDKRQNKLLEQLEAQAKCKTRLSGKRK